MRNILLIEPNYNNKYPPIGLMKLATYHKLLGDKVTFYKGDIKQLIFNNITSLCIEKLYKIDNTINWKSKYFSIKEYLKKRKTQLIEDIGISSSKYEILLLNALKYFKDYYWKGLYKQEPQWDRICITTLFTFHWDITVKTIEQCKALVKSENEIWIGGVMASVIPEELKKSTKLNNIFPGLLNRPGILDKNDIIIDTLPLDYSIIDEIDYEYPENGAYYGYTTRGCIRKCEFCAVPLLEPKFEKYVSLTDKIEGVRVRYGEKKNLLLLDNNILASSKFKSIIEEIKANGFDKLTKYIEPNQLDISIRNLKEGINDAAYIKKIIKIYNEVLAKLKFKEKQSIYNLLFDNNLLYPETATIDGIMFAYPIVSKFYEKYRNKIPKQRYVDYNQGIDARLITDVTINLLAQIPIRPLRIAFDSMKYEKDYINAISLSQGVGIRHFSNYLLYNYDDSPVDLYRRLKINVELCEKYHIDIYSFPMKYHPIFGDYHLNRDYIGNNWNRKFIRAIQLILNATKGKIGKGKSFFLKAFGHNEEEFHKLLYMPELYIFFRFFFEKNGFTNQWWEDFNSLDQKEMRIARNVIESNDFQNILLYSDNENVIKVLEHYVVSKNHLLNSNSQLYKLKIEFDKLDKIDKYGFGKAI
jgi:hypothetical protein